MRAVDETPDPVLALRAGAGDTAAFAALVVRHQLAAIRLATIVGGSVDDASDIVQEAFVNAFAALPRQPELLSVRSWLLRIVANEAKNHRRSRGRRIRREDRYSTWMIAPPDNPASSALQAVEARTLVTGLALLSRRDREVIGYRYFAGLSEAETAAAMGTAVGTVKSRTARALARLKKQLSEDGAPND